MKSLAYFSAALCAPFALLGESVTWKGPSGGLWGEPANWSTEAVPTGESDVTVDKTETTVSVASAAHAKSVNLKNQNANMSIAADMSVAGEFTVGAAGGKANAVDQSAGAVTVGGTLTLGKGNGTWAVWDAYGEGTSLSAAKVNAVEYRGAAACGLTVRDGATATISGTVELGHEGAKGATPPGTGYLKVLDGSDVTINTLYFVKSGHGLVDVSNATLTVTETIRGDGSAAPSLGLDYSTFNVWDGGVVNAKAIAYSQYKSWHEQMIQWPGSKVTTSEIRLSGENQGGTGHAGDIRYIVNGGELQVSGSVNVGCNGQAEFLMHGGTTEVTGSVYVDNLRDVYDADGMLQTRYNPSKISFAGSAVFSASNGTLVMNAHDNPQKVRGGRVALELSGGLFDATVKKLDWVKVTQNPEQSILANLDRTGLAPLKVSGDVVFNTPITVVPTATKDAEAGDYPILVWGGSLSGAENVSLDESARARWKLAVDESGKRIVLRYRKPGLALIVR